MRSGLLLLAGITAALIVVLALGAFEPDEADESDVAFDAWSEDEADREDAGLRGRPDAHVLDVDPYADVADWRDLVRQADPRNQAAWDARMAALAGANEALVAELIEAMRERNSDLRLPLAWIQKALVAIGPVAVKQLVAALDDSEGDFRERVAYTLMGFGADAGPAVPRSLGIARDPSAHAFERKLMIDLLGMIGPASKDALPFLHSVLREEDADEGMEAASARALYRIGGTTEELLETFSMVLAGEWLGVREAILYVIADMRGEALPLLMDVLALLDDELDDRLYGNAIGALEAIGKADPSVLTKLVAWIEEPPYRDMPRVAAGALARLGPAGQSKLAAAAAHMDADRRRIAVEALAQNGVPQDVLLPLLPALLEHEQVWYRETALQALRRVPTDAAQTWPWLERHAAANDQDERALAILAIFALRDPPADALKVLDKALAGNDFNSELLDFGPISEPALLERALALETSDNAHHRRAVAQAWQTAPPDMTGRAVEGLLGLLNDDDAGVASAAARSLGTMGDAGRRVLPILRARWERLKGDQKSVLLYWSLNQAIYSLSQN